MQLKVDAGFKSSYTLPPGIVISLRERFINLINPILVLKSINALSNVLTTE